MCERSIAVVNEIKAKIRKCHPMISLLQLVIEGLLSAKAAHSTTNVVNKTMECWITAPIERGRGRFVSTAQVVGLSSAALAHAAAVKSLSAESMSPVKDQELAGRGQGSPRR